MSRQGTLLTRRIWGVVIVAAFIGALLISLPTIIRGAVSSAEQAGEHANLVIIGPNGHNVAAHERRQTFVILGSGFPADKEINLLLITRGSAGSVTQDISYLLGASGNGNGLTPPPMTDDTGAFGVIWNSDRFVSRGVLSADIATVWAVDIDYNIYATAPIAFCDLEAETLDNWCSAPGVVPSAP